MWNIIIAVCLFYLSCTNGFITTLQLFYLHLLHPFFIRLQNLVCNVHMHIFLFQCLINPAIKLMCQCGRNLLALGIVIITDLTVQRSLATKFVKGVLSLTAKQLIMFGTQIMKKWNSKLCLLHGAVLIVAVSFELQISNMSAMMPSQPLSRMQVSF